MKNRGFALLELVVVVGIIGIILTIVSINFGQWQVKNQIERQANEMYMEISEARQLALSTKQARSIRFSANSLVFRRYTSDADLESGEGREVKTITLPYPIIHSIWVDPSSNPNITNADILFTTRGVMDQVTPNSICIFSDVGPSADAIVIVYSRVGLGKIKLQGSKGVADCGIANIDIK